MDQIPDYIKRKHGQSAIEYPPALARVLKHTYGHVVYQEQVMQAAQMWGVIYPGAPIFSACDERKARRWRSSG